MESNFEKLRAIETERNDLLNKLQKIEEKKSTVSYEVYLKVKKDYEIRLKKLDEVLAENIELVKMEMERLQKELSELSQKERDLKLHLEEIELRYSIGEYSDDKYRELEQEVSGNLNEVTEQIKRREERIKWCKGLLGSEPIKEKKVEEKPELKPEPVVKEEEKIEELTIDEHILEESLPEDVKKLDELLVETSALLEETEKKEELKKEKKEEGIACPKCGFINPPDSWYCEKCGAEILTIN
jgi:ribosomal protein L40E